MFQTSYSASPATALTPLEAPLDSMRLQLEWHGDERPAGTFITALLSFLWPRCPSGLLIFPDGKQLEVLELPICLEQIATGRPVSVWLRPDLGLEEERRSWVLHLSPEATPMLEDGLAGGREVWLDLPMTQLGFNQLARHMEAASFAFLQAAPGTPPPMPLLGILHTGNALELTTFNNIVALATKCGALRQASLRRLPSSFVQERRVHAGSPIFQWRTPGQPASGQAGTEDISLQDTGLTGLVLPQRADVTDVGEPLLLLQGAHATQDDTRQADRTRAIEHLPGVVASAVTAAGVNAEPIVRHIRQINPAFPDLPVVPLAGLQLPAFMTTPPPDVALVVAWTQDRMTLAIDLQQPLEVVSKLVLHGLSHILLGHVRPGDAFGHWDTLASVRGEGALRRWDQQIHAAFPAWFAPPRPRIERIEDCTAQEKGWLGLWRLIGGMLGESRQLHALAETYQQAAYQRQAAQRLLAQLEEFSGAMLCDGVGLGKTYVATTLLVHYANAWRDQYQNSPDTVRSATVHSGILVSDPFRMTILAPNSVVSTWRREALPPLAAHGVPLPTIRVISHSKLSRLTRTSELLEQPAPGVMSDLEHLMLSDLVVIDEAHNFRSISARRTGVLRDLLRLQPRKDLRRRVLLLTATPVNNSLDDLLQEISLLFSRGLPLSDARTPEGYRRQALSTVQERCDRARSPRAKGDLAALVIHGDGEKKFSAALDFRTDLRLGSIADLGAYLKEQDRRLKDRQETIRAAAQDGQQPARDSGETRIAGDLLDRIVVQRSRALCKEIESQQGSQVELLFRPDAALPEKLYYSDEYDGIQDVLARFLPLFNPPAESQDTAPENPPLSLKVYMWYDVREGLLTPDQVSSVVGLQRVLVLKRLESSPVSFLITLLRLTILHAHRLQQLLNLSIGLGRLDIASALQLELDKLLRAQPADALIKLHSLATGEELKHAYDELLPRLSKSYSAARPAADPDDPPPQLSFFDQEALKDHPRREELERLWGLKDALLRDFKTLLEVTPVLADIIFGAFDRKEWPHRFLEGGEHVDWPKSAAWGRRILTDAKLRELFSRLLLARRQQQRIIVFSQFSDSLAYVHSVLRATTHFSRQDWAMVLHGLSVPDLREAELRDLLRTTRVVTGDTEGREASINAFAPFYRLGPFPPATGDNPIQDAEQLEAWRDAWRDAIRSPCHVILASDVLAEGVNLQDARALINFDVHWNPVRMIQRAGRIDRRLNPKIERARHFPELESLAAQLKLPIPLYYWHGREAEAPLTINMILPDELEAELLLRERIAVKTLAIDFTLGLEQGTGAEADWMADYQYRGISSLNAFQKDRAIEQLGSYHEKLIRIFQDRGIDFTLATRFNAWLREQNVGPSAPLVGRATLGRKGSELRPYTRYLEPQEVNGVPLWQWSLQFPRQRDDTQQLELHRLSFWLALDGRTWPPLERRDQPERPTASLPLSPTHLLSAAIRLVDQERPLEELALKDYARPLQQGASALAAGFLGTLEDRRNLGVGEFFLLQLESFRIEDALPKAQEANVPRHGLERACQVCGQPPGMHKCCPQCKTHADGEPEVERIFGFRTLKDSTSRPYQVPQTWCRPCRNRGVPEDA